MTEYPGASMKHPITRYLYRSWIQTCGPGWTGPQVAAGYVASLIFPASLIGWAIWAGLGWNGVQMLVAALLAWDLTGGAIGYNHPAMARRRAAEPRLLPVFHHNLQHIHPLILIYFAQPGWLIIITLYWLITFFFYVEYLEINPDTGQRRLGPRAEWLVVLGEIVMALVLIAGATALPGIAPNVLLSGVVIYGALIGLTMLVLITPAPFQRSAATIGIIAMIFLALALPVPAGFGWLVPVYFIKLLMGFTARQA